MSLNLSQENKTLFFVVSSLSVLITIPFPGYIFNSIAIILMSVSWLVCSDCQEKKTYLSNNYKTILTLAIPFFLSVFGLLYTENHTKGAQNIIDNLPFLIFPICFLTVKLPKTYYNSALTLYTYAVSAGCFFAISVGLYFNWMDMGNLFFYDKFSLILDKHTTYISLYIVISLLILMNNIFIRKDILFTLAQIFFQLIVLYILSVRISIVAVSLGMVILFFLSFRSRFRYVFILLIPILILIVYNSPNFQKRFDLNPTEFGEISDVEYRKLHWKAVVETIANNSVWLGTGTGGNREFLYEKYKEYKLPEAIQNEYNAHNQFLEITLNYGIIGLILFSVLILLLYIHFIRNGNTLGISFLSVFLIYFMTESLLERQIGIVLFSFLMAFLIKMDKEVEV